MKFNSLNENQKYNLNISSNHRYIMHYALKNILKICTFKI